MNYLVYLIYGGEHYNNEALYSLLSYYKFHSETKNQVVIYTDNSTYFSTYLPENIIYIDITEETIKSWRGSINFVHRVKVKVLQDAASKFDGNILYIDTDTYFTQSCAELFYRISNRDIVFDRCEGRLMDNPGGIARKMRKFLKKDNLFYLHLSKKTIIIDETFTVWNAGIIGFNSGVKELLFEVEELTDILYSKNQLFIMEQVAFSYFFQHIKYPFPAEGYIHHYWYFKEFRNVLADFFEHYKNKPFLQLTGEIHKIDPQYLSIEKRTYKKMPFWKKQWQKLIKGNKWAIPKYDL